MFCGKKFRAAFIPAAITLLGSAVVSNAAVFADFEDGNTDGFGTLTNSGVTAFVSPVTGANYVPTSGGDVTHVLNLTASGYNGGLGSGSDLGFDFAANNLTAAFMANDVLTFNWEVAPSSTTSGYAQLYGIVFNAPGYGYHTVGGSSQATDTNVTNQYPGYTGQVNTYSINYDAIKAQISANPSYLQFGITTNNGGGAPPNFYFDNFTLSSVPEPTSVALIGLTSTAGLLRRRRR